MRLVRNFFQLIRLHFDGCVLVDHRDREHKAQAVSLLHQGAFKALHRSGADAYSGTDDRIEMRFHPVSAELGTQEFNFAVGNRCRALVVAYDA